MLTKKDWGQSFSINCLIYKNVNYSICANLHLAANLLFQHVLTDLHCAANFPYNLDVCDNNSLVVFRTQSSSQYCLSLSQYCPCGTGRRTCYNCGFSTPKIENENS